MENAAKPELPAAIEAECPDCGETLHDVRKGQLSARRGMRLDVVASCRECGRTHRVLVRAVPEVEVSVIVSRGAQSSKKAIRLPEDEDVSLGDELVVGENNVQVTGLETRDGLRVDACRAGTLGTVWARYFDELVVKFSVNLRRKTIRKDVSLGPREVLNVGDELTLGRLRVRIHGIKVQGRMLRAGSAEAKEIVRVFAKPVRP